MAIPGSAQAPFLGYTAHECVADLDNWYPGDPTLCNAVPGLPAGGGNGTRLYKIPFAFDSPGLLAGTFEAYTPTVDDILEDAWFEPIEVWDVPVAVIAIADIGQFVGGSTGWWGNIAYGGGNDLTNLRPALPDSLMTNLGYLPTLLAAGILEPGMLVPARFTTTDPICICVSDSGSPGGMDPESTQGSGFLYLKVTTPITP